jgi:glycine/D-amino acid oxidase-like deaminating enzyme
LMAPITAQIISDLILHGHSEFPWQSFAPTIPDVQYSPIAEHLGRLGGEENPTTVAE